MKILKDLGDNKYEIQITPSERIKGIRENEFQMVHDYVSFSAVSYLQNENGSSSNVSFWTNLHIPIRQFVKFILPKIVSHEYAQEKHLEDRTHTEDDQYWNKDWQKNKYKEPRYRKGDKYPAYAYDNVATYFWENGERKVALLLEGEREPTILSGKLFNAIKDTTDWIGLKN